MYMWPNVHGNGLRRKGPEIILLKDSDKVCFYSKKWVKSASTDSKKATSC